MLLSYYFLYYIVFNQHLSESENYISYGHLYFWFISISIHIFGIFDFKILLSCTVNNDFTFFRILNNKLKFYIV